MYRHRLDGNRAVPGKGGGCRGGVAYAEMGVCGPGSCDERRLRKVCLEL